MRGHWLLWTLLTIHYMHFSLAFTAILHEVLLAISMWVEAWQPASQTALQNTVHDVRAGIHTFMQGHGCVQPLLMLSIRSRCTWVMSHSTFVANWVTSYIAVSQSCWRAMFVGLSLCQTGSIYLFICTYDYVPTEAFCCVGLCSTYQSHSLPKLTPMLHCIDQCMACQCAGPIW